MNKKNINNNILYNELLNKHSKLLNTLLVIFNESSNNIDSDYSQSADSDLVSTIKNKIIKHKIDKLIKIESITRSDQHNMLPLIHFRCLKKIKISRETNIEVSMEIQLGRSEKTIIIEDIVFYINYLMRIFSFYIDISVSKNIIEIFDRKNSIKIDYLNEEGFSSQHNIKILFAFNNTKFIQNALLGKNEYEYTAEEKDIFKLKYDFSIEDVKNDLNNQKYPIILQQILV